MCYLITATLAPEADLEAVRAVASPEGSAWTSLPNEFVQRQLPKRCGYYRLTGSICDCQSALTRGDAARGKTVRLPRHAGSWSQAKRDRWLEQRGALIEGSDSAARGDVIAWHEYLKRVLRASGKAPVGLLIHFYRGRIDKEHVSIDKRVSLKVDTLAPAALQCSMSSCEAVVIPDQLRAQGCRRAP